MPSESTNKLRAAFLDGVSQPLATFSRTEVRTKQPSFSQFDREPKLIVENLDSTLKGVKKSSPLRVMNRSRSRSKDMVPTNTKEWATDIQPSRKEPPRFTIQN